MTVSSTARCCYCANDLSTGPQTKLVLPGDTRQCTTPCSGDLTKKEMCGGAYRVEVIDLGACNRLAFAPVPQPAAS